MYKSIYVPYSMLKMESFAYKHAMRYHKSFGSDLSSNTLLKIEGTNVVPR